MLFSWQMMNMQKCVTSNLHGFSFALNKEQMIVLV